MDDRPFKLRYRPRKGDKPKPKRKGRAGNSEAIYRVAERIRPMVEAGEAINREAICQELDVSHGTYDSALYYAQGILKGIDESAPTNVISRRKLAKELGPIIRAIRTEGRKASVLIAPSVLLRAASDLEKLMNTLVPITGIAADNDAPVLSSLCPQEERDEPL